MQEAGWAAWDQWAELPAVATPQGFERVSRGRCLHLHPAGEERGSGHPAAEWGSTCPLSLTHEAGKWASSGLRDFLHHQPGFLWLPGPAGQVSAGAQHCRGASVPALPCQLPHWQGCLGLSGFPMELLQPLSTSLDSLHSAHPSPQPRGTGLHLPLCLAGCRAGVSILGPPEHLAASP